MGQSGKVPAAQVSLGSMEMIDIPGQSRGQGCLRDTSWAGA